MSQEAQPDKSISLSLCIFLVDHTNDVIIMSSHMQP